MKQLSTIICFSFLFISMIMMQSMSGDVITQLRDNSETLIGSNQIDASSHPVVTSSILDDVTDLNELSDELKQTYIKSRQEATTQTSLSDFKNVETPSETIQTTTTSLEAQQDDLIKNTPSNVLNDIKEAKIDLTTKQVEVTTEPVSLETSTHVSTPQLNTKEDEEIKIKQNDEISVETSTSFTVIKETTLTLSPSFKTTTNEVKETETSTINTIPIETTTIEATTIGIVAEETTTIEATTIGIVAEETTNKAIVKDEIIPIGIVSEETTVAMPEITTTQSVKEEIPSETTSIESVAVIEKETATLESIPEVINQATKKDEIILVGVKEETSSIETTTTESITEEATTKSVIKEEIISIGIVPVETTAFTPTKEETIELVTAETSTQMASFDQEPVLMEPTVVTREETSHETNKERKHTSSRSILSNKRLKHREHKEEEAVETSTQQTGSDYSSYSPDYEANQTNTSQDSLVVTLTGINHQNDKKVENKESSQLLMDQHLNSPNESVNNIAVTQDQYTTVTSYLATNEHVNPKYCADFKPIKDLFNQHIENFYKPVISLLPEDFQLLLLDETHIAGLNTAACLLILTVLSLFLSVWYVYLRRQQLEQYKQTVRLNEKMLIMENSLKKMTFEKQTFESEYTDLETKYAEIQMKLTDKEDKLKQANDLITQLTQTNNLNHKEIEKFKSNEIKLSKDLNAFKIELANLREKNLNEMDDFESKLINATSENETKIACLNTKLNDSDREIQLNRHQISELEVQVKDLKENEVKLNETLIVKEKMVQMLQNSLLQFSKKDIEIKTELTDEPLVVVNDTNTQTFDGLIKIAELQMDIKNLEELVTNERAQLLIKTNELISLEERFNERQIIIDKLEHRQKDFDKLNKDQEMQIRLLNELREKDTKQHLKALSDLDAQLKKKSNDADKISHFLEQLRVKQERIQELETQLARVERQANQERQQNDKQAHENWLQARKIEKELKEAKIEITSLKDRCSELEILNKNLNENNNLMRQTLPGKQTMAQNSNFYMSPNYMYQQQQLASASQISRKSNESPNKDVEPEEVKQMDQPLQLDTLIENRQASSSSPSGSSTSGVVPNQIPHMYNPYMIRPAGVAAAPYRYPFPLPSPAAYMQQQQLNDSVNDATSASSTPNRGMIPPGPYPPAYGMVPPPYRINPMLFQQQQQYLQQQYQQFQQSKSASSSQQPSPGANTTMPYSHTYPSHLNDSSGGLTRETQSNLEEVSNEASEAANLNQSTGYDSNFNV